MCWTRCCCSVLSVHFMLLPKRNFPFCLSGIVNSMFSTEYTDRYIRTHSACYAQTSASMQIQKILPKIYRRFFVSWFWTFMFIRLGLVTSSISLNSVSLNFPCFIQFLSFLLVQIDFFFFFPHSDRFFFSFSRSLKVSVFMRIFFLVRLQAITNEWGQ